MKLRITFQSAKDKAAMQAAYDGDFTRALDLIEKGANPNARRRFTSKNDRHGWEGNIGFSAINHNRADALEKALDLGLDPNLTMKDSDIPLLRMAIVSQRENMALLLIARGADTKSYQNHGFDSDLSLAYQYKLPKVAAVIEGLIPEHELQSARERTFHWPMKWADERKSGPVDTVKPKMKAFNL